MKYALNLTGFEGRIIEVESGGLFHSPTLLVNGKKVEMEKKSKSMLLQKNDGTEVKCKWKQKMFGLDMPELEVDGEVIQVVKPLHWGIWVWCLIPVLLIFVGGMLGAFIGIICSTINILVFRADFNKTPKFILTVVVTLAAYIIYFVAATFVHLLIQG